MVAVGLGLLGLLSWLILRLAPFDGARGGGSRAVAGPTAAGADQATDGATDDSAAAAPAVVLGAASPTSAASELIAAWADAWSEGRVDEYLSYYSDDFTPANGLGLRQWRASRTERLSSAQYIRVSITALELEVLAADRMRATFFQNYRSDRFEDTVRKQLELGIEEGRWRILLERVIG